MPTLCIRSAGVCLVLLIGAAVPGCGTSPSSYEIGNATPSSVLSVQGQSFTPSVFGNESSGSTPGSPPTTVYLTSFTVDYAFSVGAVAHGFLYIYDSPPSQSAAATGAGSRATGTLTSGGKYSFSSVALNYSTKYYAVLPDPASIFDASGNAYTGGTDMYLRSDGIIAEGGGAFDIGFNATFGSSP